MAKEKATSFLKENNIVLVSSMVLSQEYFLRIILEGFRNHLRML
jgi:hypothetical protein